MNEENVLDGIKFEAQESTCPFECDSAVFPVGNNSSLCYTTSMERAEAIANALNRQPDTGLVEALEQIIGMPSGGYGLYNSPKECDDCIIDAQAIAEKALAKYKGEQDA